MRVLLMALCLALLCLVLSCAKPSDQQASQPPETAKTPQPKAEIVQLPEQPRSETNDAVGIDGESEPLEVEWISDSHCRVTWRTGVEIPGLAALEVCLVDSTGMELDDPYIRVRNEESDVMAMLADGSGEQMSLVIGGQNWRYETILNHDGDQAGYCVLPRHVVPESGEGYLTHILWYRSLENWKVGPDTLIVDFNWEGQPGAQFLLLESLDLEAEILAKAQTELAK